MGKTLSRISRNSIEKILTGLSTKTGIPLLFRDMEGNQIKCSGAFDDLPADPEEEPVFCGQAPVSINGTVVGNISGSTEAKNLDTLLNMAAYCIENSFRLEHEIEDLSAEIVRVYQELSLIYSLSSKLGSELDINIICQQVVEEISKVLDVKTIVILLLDELNGMLSVQSSTGIESKKVNTISVAASTEPFAKIFSTKKATVISERDTTDSFQLSLQDALCVPLVTDNRNIGILIARDKTTGEDFRTPEIKLLDALSGEIAGAIKKAQLYEKINRLFICTVEALASAIDAKDPYTYGHSQRVAQISSNICKEIGLTSDEIHFINLAALLHDIGKIGTPEHILQKPGRLQPDEMEKIKEHPLKGAQILSTIDELRDVRDWIKHHHERYDGEGYPDKVVALNIPLPARIISIADSFDAMTSDRPYRKGMDPDKVIDIMGDDAGSQYDPQIFKAFKLVFNQKKPELP